MDRRIRHGGGVRGVGRARAAPRGDRIGWIVAAAAIFVAVWLAWIHFREPMAETQSIQFTIPTEARIPSQVRISPDGTRLAFVGQNAEGKIVLWVGPLDGLRAQALAGTEGARYPFWSPDSRQIGYFVWPQKLMRSRDGTILFSPSANEGTGIYRVNASGGTPVEVTNPGKSAKVTYAFPVLLPDGRHFLYLVRPNSSKGPSGEGGIFAGSLDFKETKRLVATAYSSTLLPRSKTVPPYLLFVHDGALMGQEMNLAGPELRGEPFRILDTIATDAVYNFADFSVSENGILAHNSAVHQHELVWLDRTGKRLGSGTPVDRYAHPTLAAGARYAIFERMDPKDARPVLWRLDADRGEVSLFASSGGIPVFMRDGNTVAFSCALEGENGICRKSAGGASSEELMWESNSPKYAMDFSPDGRFMSYTAGGSAGLWILPLEGERRPYLFYPSASLLFHGRFSPDGKWIAYTSAETGDFEVYVQPFPATGEKWAVSAHGGGEPRWSQDMKEMFYRTMDGKMMAVPLKTTPRFEAGEPRMLFQSSADPLFPNLGIPYAVTADGQRFLVNAAIDESRTPPITVITNWTAELTR